jgi:hypothetical protein
MTVSGARLKLENSRLKFGDAEQIELLRVLQMFKELKKYGKDHVCIYCDGKGYERCDACDGDGFCPHCGRSCDECDDGRKPCSLCRGFGRAPSPEADIQIVKDAYGILQQRLRMAV